MEISEVIKDIVANAIGEKPFDMQTSLDVALREKIASALSAKKVEIAHNLVGQNQ